MSPKGGVAMVRVIRSSLRTVNLLTQNARWVTGSTTRLRSQPQPSASHYRQGHPWRSKRPTSSYCARTYSTSSPPSAATSSGRASTTSWASRSQWASSPPNDGRRHDGVQLRQRRHQLTLAQTLGTPHAQSHAGRPRSAGAPPAALGDREIGGVRRVGRRAREGKVGLCASRLFAGQHGRTCVALFIGRCLFTLLREE